ncbi:MAG: hypothetical protein CSA25_00320 [Desulfobacter postgatei]|uniref:Uncharacterized protein n=1 Tax=Desulfobacter postgatei TaxID=2293 RepID=A0A2G6MTM2_9BACT|nr:MAG: hypothetical protein CSA25_00320 [Desulfobacter postgatei]
MDLMPPDLIELIALNLKQNLKKDLPGLELRACLIIRGSKRNLMKMRTNFYKFCFNSRTIDIKFGGIGAIFMGLQPIHQLSNRL